MKQTKEEAKLLIEKLKLRDRVVRAISKDGKFRIAAIKNTNSAREAQKRHNLPHIPAFFLARSLSAATMMSSFLKGEERITLEFEGSAYINYIYAEALQVGEVKGFIEFDKQKEPKNIDSLPDLLGIGLLKVVRILYNNKEPIVSIIELNKSDIATDIAYYYTQSEQIPTAVILDVDIDEEGIIRQSGGILVQALPGAMDKDIKSLYDNLSEFKSIIKYLDEGLTPDKILKQILPFEIDIIGSTQVDFFCRCSKNGFKSKLLTLDTKELTEMKNAGQNELICRYCNEKYYLAPEEFDELIEETKAKTN
jgi:molecular chaperone Hsp33